MLDGSLGGLWLSDNLETHAHINGGLTSINEFGEKVSAEGNYKISLLAAPPGETQVKKSNIFKIEHPVTEETTTTTRTWEIIGWDINPGRPSNHVELNINDKVYDLNASFNGDGYSFDHGLLTLDGTKQIYNIKGTGIATQNRIKIANGKH